MHGTALRGVSLWQRFPIQEELWSSRAEEIPTFLSIYKGTADGDLIAILIHSSSLAVSVESSFLVS